MSKGTADSKRRVRLRWLLGIVAIGLILLPMPVGERVTGLDVPSILADTAMVKRSGDDDAHRLYFVTSRDRGEITISVTLRIVRFQKSADSWIDRDPWSRVTTKKPIGESAYLVRQDLFGSARRAYLAFERLNLDVTVEGKWTVYDQDLRTARLEEIERMPSHLIMRSFDEKPA